ERAATPKGYLAMSAPMREKMIGMMDGAGLVAILFLSWPGQVAAGARTASRHQHRNVPRTC
ncbi:MAG: hypothetical protein WCC76_02405, partial [Candidatus Acidiferrales bacterium]